MLNYILVSIISFLGGAFLMNFITIRYLKIILILIRHDPESLQDPEIKERIEELLK